LKIIFLVLKREEKENKYKREKGIESEGKVKWKKEEIVIQRNTDVK
jgi:hypothetical protein